MILDTEAGRRNVARMLHPGLYIGLPTGVGLAGLDDFDIRNAARLPIFFGYNATIEELRTRYLHMLRKLLPRGPIWDFINDTFELVLQSFAQEPARVHQQSDVFLRETNPNTTTTEGLLSAWEEFVLLPDEMPLGTETEAQRRAVVTAKLFRTHVPPTPASFVALALELGMTVIITDQNDSVGVDDAEVDTDEVFGLYDAFNFNIEVVADPDSQLTKYQGMVNRLKPAHTTVTYT